MLEILLIGGVIYFIIKGGQLNLSASTTPVINNATGGSLSAALGNQSNPPSTFSTGAPGYSSNPTPPPGIAGPSASPSGQPVTAAGQPGNIAVRQPRYGIAHNNVRLATNRLGIPTKVQQPPNVVAPVCVKVFNPATQTVQNLNPALTQSTPVTARNSPEVASPFWTPNPRAPKVRSY